MYPLKWVKERQRKDKRNCEKKIVYSAEGPAWESARKQKKHIKLEPYVCPVCNKYHLTKRKEKVNK
jgi:hypothetical protein